MLWGVALEAETHAAPAFKVFHELERGTKGGVTLKDLPALMGHEINDGFGGGLHVVPFRPQPTTAGVGINYTGSCPRSTRLVLALSTTTARTAGSAARTMHAQRFSPDARLSHCGFGGNN